MEQIKREMMRNVPRVVVFPEFVPSSRYLKFFNGLSIILESPFTCCVPTDSALRPCPDLISGWLYGAAVLVSANVLANCEAVCARFVYCNLGPCLFEMISGIIFFEPLDFVADFGFPAQHK